MTHSRLGARAAAALLLTLAACNDPTTPRRIATPPDSLAARPSIVDGAHRGNAHFFFLPPLVASPRFAGESDDTQSPTVVVCELNTDDGNSCRGIVAQFGRGDGSTPGDIVYDATSGQYQVDWKTDQCVDGPCVLDVAKTYRLRVLIGAYEVGHADLDVVSSGKELRNVDTGEYIGLVEGRTLPIKFRIEKGAVSVAAPGEPVRIGAAGGVLATVDGMVSLDVPAGAVSNETSITVSAVTEQLPGVGEWAPAIELGPDGTTFDVPVTLTMSFDGSKLPPGIPPSAVSLYTWRDGSWEPVTGSVTNVTDNTVSAPISHFSTYALAISPNILTGRPPLTLYYGDATALSGYTVAYDVRAATYCYSQRVLTHLLFWYRWVYVWRCTTVYTPYQYYPVGQRVYWRLQAAATVPPPLQLNGPIWPTPLYGSLHYSVVGAGGNTASPMLLATAPGQQMLIASVETPVCGIFNFCLPLNTDVWSSVITVLDPPVARVVVTPSAAKLTLTSPGNTAQLSVTLYDAAGSVLMNRGFTFSSSDPSVATVGSNGIVTAKNPGTTTIIVTSEGITGTATITVDADGYILSFSAGAVNSGVHNIYMQTTGSADATRVALTTGAFDDQAARWSRNGTRLLFTSNRSGGGAWELYMLSPVPSATPKRISTAGGLTANGDLSPVDPSAAVFMRGYRIWTMNVDAPNPDATAVQITNTPFDENQPKYSPDGRWITWVRQPRAGTDVWVMNANDPSQAFQVTDLGDYARNPSWSPDGTKIVFSRQYDIYIADVINPATGTVRALTDVRITRLTFDGSWNDTPVWSPDGRKIVWAAEPASARGQTDLMMMNADGTGVERITSTPGINEAWPAFRPRLCDVFAEPNCNPAAP